MSRTIVLRLQLSLVLPLAPEQTYAQIATQIKSPRTCLSNSDTCDFMELCSHLVYIVSKFQDNRTTCLAVTSICILWTLDFYPDLIILHHSSITYISRMADATVSNFCTLVYLDLLYACVSCLSTPLHCGTIRSATSLYDFWCK